MNKQHLSIKAWYFLVKSSLKVWLKVDFHCLVIFTCVRSSVEEMYERCGVYVKTLKLDQVYVWYIASTLFMQRQKKCDGGHLPYRPFIVLVPSTILLIKLLCSTAIYISGTH